MVKSRRQAQVTTDLPPSRPADVPVVSAAANEIVPEKAPQLVPSSPSTSDEPDASRPIRVYADGELNTTCIAHSLSRLARCRYDSLSAGIFDLFHFGHAKALEQAKKM